MHYQSATAPRNVSPDVIEALERTGKRIRNLYLSDKAFTATAFKFWQSLISCAPEHKAERTSSKLVFRQAGDRSPGDPKLLHAHYKVGAKNAKVYIRLVAKPLPTGHVGRPSSLLQMVTRKVFRGIIVHVKELEVAAAHAVNAELQRRFPSHALLIALGILHPCFYLKGTFEEFEKHLQELCSHYGTPKQTARGRQAAALLDSDKLRDAAPFFFEHARSIARNLLVDEVDSESGTDEDEEALEDDPDDEEAEVQSDDEEAAAAAEVEALDDSDSSDEDYASLSDDSQDDDTADEVDRGRCLTALMMRQQMISHNVAAKLRARSRRRLRKSRACSNFGHL
jgi:hypothetical protein